MKDKFAKWVKKQGVKAMYAALLSQAAVEVAGVLYCVVPGKGIVAVDGVGIRWSGIAEMIERETNTFAVLSPLASHEVTRELERMI